MNEGSPADSLRRRGKTIKIFDVDAGDKRPVVIVIPLAGGVDGVYVVALVDGRPVVPRHRAPSYPYHNYEWNSGAPKLAGMTFRLPIDLTD